MVWDDYEERLARWTDRQYLRHALTLALSQDRATSEHTARVLEGDTPPPAPWRLDGDDQDETPAQEQARLKLALDQGREWPFFRDRRLDAPTTATMDAQNGHHHDSDDEPPRPEDDAP